jgi:mannosyltransferase
MTSSTQATRAPERLVKPRAANRPQTRRITAAALGVLGFLVAFAGSWIPSYWGDEAASVLSAQRSLPSLFRMLGNVDAVHGTYYVFLHFWVGAFGTSPLATRLPSALAVGVIVAGTFLIGERLASVRVGIAAAVVCAVLPRVDFFGGEARSYPFATAIVVWLTLVLIVLIGRRERRWLPWLGYALLLALGVYVFLYGALMVPVHLAYLASTRSGRRQLSRWAGAVVVAILLSAPLLAIAYQQRGQISFLSNRRHLNWRSIFIYQWLGNGYLAALVWALVVCAIVLAVLAWRRRSERDELVILAGLWMLLPVGLLFGISVVVPTYDLRYLSIGAPAVALLAAVGIARVPWRFGPPIAVAAVVALAAPTDVGQRQPNAYNVSSDWSAAAAIVGAHGHRGDAIVFDATTRPSQRPRLAYRLYPASFGGLADVELKSSFTTRTLLWDSTYQLDQVKSRLAGVHTVWLLELDDTVDADAGGNVFTLLGWGYTEHVVGTSGRMIVYRFTRDD